MNRLMVSVLGVGILCLGACGATILDLQKRIDDASAKGGGTVTVPAGEWETKPILMKSNVTLELSEGAVLLGSTNLVDYANASVPGTSRAFVEAEGAENIAIIGKGRFDGRGDGFVEHYAHGAAQPKVAPKMMKFAHCKNVRLEDFTYGRSGSWGIHLMASDGVTVRRVKCFNHFNRCNDGIDIESRNVLIEDCDFDSMDDAVCFKSESEPSFVIENVTVRNCRIATTCNFVKFGTGSYGQWKNILIEKCFFHPAARATRHKWNESGVVGVKAKISGLAGLALEVVDGGTMENVTIRDITMDGGVGTPIFVRFARRHAPLPGTETYFKNVLIERVKMLKPAESRIASSITGLPNQRITGVTVRDCDLFFPGGGTAQEAADTNVPEVPKGYPEYFLFGLKRALPAYGFYIRHAEGVKIENVNIRLAAPDARPKFHLEDTPNPALWEALAKPVLSESYRNESYEKVIEMVEQADRHNDEAWTKMATEQEYGRRARLLRKSITQSLRLDRYAGRDCPLNARTVATLVRDDYVVEKLYFQSLSNFHVTANLFLPKNPKFKAPYPAILLPCGHTANGKGGENYQRGCVLAAKAGFACLIYDPIDQGERYQTSRRNSCLDHNRVGFLAALLGENLATFRIGDGRRAIDYLQSRSEIDKGRIGVMGQSGGGTMSAYLFCLDDRIKAACPSCFISTYRAVGEWCKDAEQIFFGQLGFGPRGTWMPTEQLGLSHAGFILARPGVPVRLHFCRDDFFPIEGSRETYTLIQKVAKQFKFEDKVDALEVEGPHNWRESQRQSSVDWMRRWLKGEKVATAHEAYRALDKTFDPKKNDMGLTAGEEKVLPEGGVLTLPGERTIYDVLRAEFDSLRATEGAKIKRAEALEKLVPEMEVKRGEVVREKIGDVEVVREKYEVFGGLVFPAVTFIPKIEKGDPVLVVGNGPRTQRTRYVLAALCEGRRVTVLDVLGTGEICSPKPKQNFFGTSAEIIEEGVASRLYAMGLSLVTFQASTIAAVARDIFGRTSRPVELVARQRVCIAAAHAKAVETKAIGKTILLERPLSWKYALEHGERLSYSEIVESALIFYDWTDL